MCIRWPWKFSAGCNLILTEVSFWVGYGAHVRSLRKKKVDLYRRMPQISFKTFIFQVCFLLLLLWRTGGRTGGQHQIPVTVHEYHLRIFMMNTRSLQDFLQNCYFFPSLFPPPPATDARTPDGRSTPTTGNQSWVTPEGLYDQHVLVLNFSSTLFFVMFFHLLLLLLRQPDGRA